MFKFKRIPLHVSILGIFLLLISLLTAIVVAYGHHRSTRAALGESSRLLQEMGAKVFERTKGVYDPAFAVAEAVTVLPQVGIKPDLHSHGLARIFMRFLEDNHYISALYMGFSDGDFYEVLFLGGESRKKVRQVLGAPDTARFGVEIITISPGGERVKIWRFLDAAKRTVGSRTETGVAYDPRAREWYRQARDASGAILTGLYAYSFSREVGRTVARRFDGPSPGVLGVDIALSAVSEFLVRERLSQENELVVFDRLGLVSAYTEPSLVVKSVTRDAATKVEPAHIRDLKSPVLDALFARFSGGKEGRTSMASFAVEGVDYIAWVEAVPRRYGRDQYLAIAVPEGEFLEPLARARRDSLLVSLAVVVLFVPLVFWTARRIAQPLARLAEEAREIRHMRFDSPLTVQSRIHEVDQLARSMASMKSGLQSFGKYVPRALVDKMVRMGITPELGGERRELTLMFSDVADFTTLSEGLSAEELTARVSYYFQEMGTVILERGGTIDKYIGDGIMAFWNAPDLMDNHAAQACLAALLAQHRLEGMNADWAEKGQASMPTRFGLHTAEVVVGNVGSEDRMDYTAMGSAVNLTSRIEGLNKYFGTWIMASGAVADRAGDGFLFRSVGLVTPKGAVHPVRVHELVGLRRAVPDLCGEICMRIMARDGAEDYCARWEKAYALYLARDWKGASEAMAGLVRENGGDPVAEHYLELAGRYAAKSPPEDWDGVEVFHVK